jgi:hypothetical protein
LRAGGGTRAGWRFTDEAVELIGGLEDVSEGVTPAELDFWDRYLGGTRLGSAASGAPCTGVRADRGALVVVGEMIAAVAFRMVVEMFIVSAGLRAASV